MIASELYIPSKTVPKEAESLKKFVLDSLWIDKPREVLHTKLSPIYM